MYSTVQTVGIYKQLTGQHIWSIAYMFFLKIYDKILGNNKQNCFIKLLWILELFTKI